MLSEGEELVGAVFLGIVPAETVEGDEDDVVSFEGLGGVGAMVGVEDREWRLGLAAADGQKYNRGEQSGRYSSAKLSGHKYTFTYERCPKFGYTIEITKGDSLCDSIHFPDCL